MVLLNDVVQVVAMAQQDTNAGISLDTFNGCCICATLVDAQLNVLYALSNLYMAWENDAHSGQGGA